MQTRGVKDAILAESLAEGSEWRDRRAIVVGGPAAEMIAGAIGERTNDGDFAYGFGQRQTLLIVFEQNKTLLGELFGQLQFGLGRRGGRLG